jgi:hypothetical protein
MRATGQAAQMQGFSKRDEHPGFGAQGSGKKDAGWCFFLLPSNFEIYVFISYGYDFGFFHRRNRKSASYLLINPRRGGV